MTDEINASEVREKLAAVTLKVAEIRSLSRRTFTKNTLAITLIERAKLYANYAESQHAEVVEMLSISDSYESAEKAALLRQALWTVEVSLSMVTAGVAMLNAAALEIAVDHRKDEGMRPLQ